MKKNAKINTAKLLKIADLTTPLLQGYQLISLQV
jgi:hypothetical protein